MFVPLVVAVACSGGLPDCSEVMCLLPPVVLRVEGDYEAGSRIEFCGKRECTTAEVSDTALEMENFAPFLLT